MSEMEPTQPYDYMLDLRLAIGQADIYINEAPSDRLRIRRSREVIEELNGLIVESYLHEPVTVFGIHKKASFAKDGGIHVYLKDGASSGLSDGFVVADLEQDFDDIEHMGSKRQLEFLQKLREQSLGRHVVSHLLTSTDGYSLHRTDFLFQADFRMRILAPAFTSYLFTDSETEIPQDSLTLETERIISTADPESQRLIQIIEEDISRADEPLGALIHSARKFRGLGDKPGRGSQAPLQSALVIRLQQILDEPLFGQAYQFENGLPVCLVPQANGRVATRNVDIENYQVVFTDIAVAPHFEKTAGAEHGSFTDERALHLVGYPLDAGKLDYESIVIVPLEHMYDQKYTRLEDTP